MMATEMLEETKQTSAARLRNQNRAGALLKFEDRRTYLILERPRHGLLRVSMKSIAVPDKSPYVLKEPLAFKVVEEQNRVLIQPIGLHDRQELFAEGEDLSKAWEDFGRRFDRWVQRNWRVPPHARTAKNARVIRILDHLVDWERYKLDNPLVQPMWGRILGRSADGGLRAFWIFGPDQARNQEATLAKGNVPPALREMRVGQWFYGTARCFPGRVEWIEVPRPVPDPEDEKARAELLESLPVVFANEPGCWPLRPK